jgi:hypothetical protein
MAQRPILPTPRRCPSKAALNDQQPPAASRQPSRFRGIGGCKNARQTHENVIHLLTRLRCIVVHAAPTDLREDRQGPIDQVVVDGVGVHAVARVTDGHVVAGRTRQHFPHVPVEAVHRHWINRPRRKAPWDDHAHTTLEPTRNWRLRESGLGKRPPNHDESVWNLFHVAWPSRDRPRFSSRRRASVASIAVAANVSCFPQP